MRNLILLISSLTLLACSSSHQGLGLAGWEEGELLRENKTNDRAYVQRAQAPILRENQAKAKSNATKRARLLAIDRAAREFLSRDAYNRNHDKIWQAIRRRPNLYVKQTKNYRSGPLDENRLYGISAGYLIDRTAIAQLLQKQLKILNQSHSSILVLVETPGTQDLKALGYRVADLEAGLVSGLSAQLHGAGFQVMDYQNLLVSLKQNPAIGNAANKLSPQDYFELASQTSGAASGPLYTKALPHLKGLAKVVVKLNLEQLSYSNNQLHISMSATAVNIATVSGGSIAQSRFRVLRHGGAKAEPSAMIAASISDLLVEMNQAFLPKIYKEFNVVNQAPGKLLPYRLTLMGFDKEEVGRMIKALKGAEDKDFRYIGQSLLGLREEYPIVEIDLRYGGRPAQLSDRVTKIADTADLSAMPPLVDEGLLDLVLREE